MACTRRRADASVGEEDAQGRRDRYCPVRSRTGIFNRAVVSIDVYGERVPDAVADWFREAFPDAEVRLLQRRVKSRELPVDSARIAPDCALFESWESVRCKKSVKVPANRHNWGG